MMSISAKRKQLEKELKQLEQNIYDKETEYLNDTQVSGNLVDGWK